MKNYFTKLIVLALIVLFGGTAFSQTITVSVAPGKNWKMKRDPQCAIWIEKSDGTFCKTLFVTSGAGKKSWIFAPKEGRPESLPVWYACADVNPQKKEKVSNIDAVTSATPNNGLIIKESFAFEKNTTYFIKAEFNHSFDYNDYWKKKAKKTDSNFSGVNGQPSIIYSGELPVSGEIALYIEGTGNVLKKDKKIYDELDTLTTAKDIVANIFVTVGE